MEESLLSALAPVILLLALGVAVAVVFRALRLGPIVGYLVLGVTLGAAGLVEAKEPVALLAELGVVFLLFDVGLHFSTRHVRQHAVDVFGLGSAQLLFGTLGLGLIAFGSGLPPGAALFVGGTLALSSTAVVGRIIADRGQQGCPVGMAATGILVFQDLAAIFLLIIATTAETGAPMLPALGAALAKSVVALAIALLCARLLVQPVFDLVARSRNEEVFTAMALLVALSAGWATGSLGLSLTLGAFLGGMMLVDTPYRAVIQSEVKPFRGLLLGFFFVHVGLTLDVELLRRWRLVILASSVLLMLAKTALNAAASLALRWSLPGSVQLGFLLAQGSEFALVILALPPARAMIGEALSDVLIAAVVISLGATPQVATIGRALAGKLRRRIPLCMDAELEPRDLAAPVLIVGIGQSGRTIADALIAFGIRYVAIEFDARRLRRAIADGYQVVFGDLGDARLWEPAAMHEREISVLTRPSFEVSSRLSPVAQSYYPGLTRIALVGTPAEAAQWAMIGVVPAVEQAGAPGVVAAMAVLARLGIDRAAIDAWAGRQRALLAPPPRLDLAAI